MFPPAAVAAAPYQETGSLQALLLSDSGGSKGSTPCTPPQSFPCELFPCVHWAPLLCERLQPFNSVLGRNEPCVQILLQLQPRGQLNFHALADGSFGCT